MMLARNTLTHLAQILGSPNSLGIPDQRLESSSVTDIVNVVLMFAGFVAVIVIIIAGISYSTSAGDAGKMTKARNTIVFSLVGMAVILLSAAIVGFVIGAVW